MSSHMTLRPKALELNRNKLWSVWLRDGRLCLGRPRSLGCQWCCRRALCLSPKLQGWCCTCARSLCRVVPSTWSYPVWSQYQVTYHEQMCRIFTTSGNRAMFMLVITEASHLYIHGRGLTCAFAVLLCARLIRVEMKRVWWNENSMILQHPR